MPRAGVPVSGRSKEWEGQRVEAEIWRPIVEG